MKSPNRTDTKKECLVWQASLGLVTGAGDSGALDGEEAGSGEGAFFAGNAGLIASERAGNGGNAGGRASTGRTARAPPGLTSDIE